jgi:heme exporter protein CcmD
MDRYAFYVWGSYLAALILIGGEVALLIKRKKDLKRQASLHAIEQRSSSEYKL